MVYPVLEKKAIRLSSRLNYIIINGDALLLFQLVYFAACLPAFLFQFIPFMRRYKIQRVIFLIYLYLAYI